MPLDCMTKDGYALLQQGLATMVRVAQSEDLKHAMAAADWLVRYGEQILAEKRVKPVPEKALYQSREGVIAELRGLYAKALGEAPLIVEASAESESQPEKP